MKKQIIKEIQFPENVKVSQSEGQLIMQGKNSSSIRKIPRGIFVELKENMIILQHPKATKKEKKIIHTESAHLKNIIEGLQRPFVYKLKICNVHFPMTVSINENKVVIKNFLGEVKERLAKIIDDVEVKIDKEIITVTSSNIEHAGQTAANIEFATHIRNRDRRVFQDGIFIIEKAGGDK